MTNMEAKSKWSCRSCGVIVPYNPEYIMDNVLCNRCLCYHYADKLMQGYRMPKKRKV